MFRSPQWTSHALGFPLKVFGELLLTPTIIAASGSHIVNKQLPMIVWTRSPEKDSEWALTQVRVGISREFQTSQTMTVLWERGFPGEFLTRLLPPAAALLLVFTATWFGGYHFFFFYGTADGRGGRMGIEQVITPWGSFSYWDSAVFLKLFFRLLQFFGLFSEFWKGCFW